MNIAFSPSVFAASLLLASFSAFAQTADAPKDPYSESAPALVRSIAAGSERACSPVYLTVSGPEVNGSRFYVSAPLAKFSSLVRESSSKRGQKLSKAQARAIDHLINLAQAAKRDGMGFSADTIRSALAGTGLSGEAQMLCVSVERVSAEASR